MGTGQNPRRGNGDGDGLNYVPVPVPIPERGLIFLPVPVPVPFGNGDFPPLRGGAPAGTGIPQLFAIPSLAHKKTCPSRNRTCLDTRPYELQDTTNEF